jgi:hypothetical protein
MAADFFVVPSVTFRLLFVLIILAHDRRRIVHVAVTEHPTAAWTAQQLRNAFSEHDAPQYLLHDRDSVFADVATTIAGMNTHTMRTAPQSPWQNAYAERVIGSIRRECLDHVVVVNAAGLHRLLTAYISYYMESRTHLALAKDAPISRPVTPSSVGRIVARAHVGGLHHRYDRAAAYGLSTPGHGISGGIALYIDAEMRLLAASCRKLFRTLVGDLDGKGANTLQSSFNTCKISRGSTFRQLQPSRAGEPMNSRLEFGGAARI